MSLQGKNALVTGGSRGIGRAICLELARQGANVAVNYAGNAKAAEETVEACKALGVQAVAIQADGGRRRRLRGHGEGGHLHLWEPPDPGELTRASPGTTWPEHQRGRLRRGAGHQPDGGFHLLQGGLPPHDAPALTAASST